MENLFCRNKKVIRMSKLKLTIKNFYPILKCYIGKPFKYLEIGVFRGTTIKWVLDNIATHNDSQLWGVDPWERSYFSNHDIKDNNEWNILAGICILIYRFSHISAVKSKNCKH